MKIFVALLLLVNLAMGMEHSSEEMHGVEKDVEILDVIREIVQEVPVELGSTYFVSAGVEDECQDVPDEVMSVEAAMEDGEFFNCEGVSLPLILDVMIIINFPYCLHKRWKRVMQCVIAFPLASMVKPSTRITALNVPWLPGPLNLTLKGSKCSKCLLNSCPWSMSMKWKTWRK